MENLGKYFIKGKSRTVYSLNGKKYYNEKVNNKIEKKYIRNFDKRFKYNPDDKSKSFDVYVDKNPKDTIPIKYKTLDDVKKTIRKLERLYKNGKYTHKRIWQVGMILYVRLRAMKGKKRQKKLAERYHKFLGERTKVKGKNKKETFLKRKKKFFKI